MAFFKKLKDRLFKSSSKIDEGLEAIVSDGGEEETVPVDAVMEEAPAAAAEDPRAAEALARQAEEEAARQEAIRREQEEREAAERAAAEERAARQRAEQAARERAAEEAARALEAERARAAEERAIQAAADEAARREAESAAREAEAARVAEQERLDEERRLAEESRATEEALLAEERAEAEAARRADAERQAAEEHEAEEQARRAAAEKAARDAASAAAAPTNLRTTLTPVAPDLAGESSEEPAAKPGLLGRLMGRAAPKTVVRRTLDDDMLEQLEELLITADMGVDTALRVTANMAEGRFGKKLSVAEIKELMADEIARIMDPVARPLPLYPKTPQVVLVVGVNGSGKTTTIGKLASQFRAAGKKVVIAAGDTFRAAAVEQLQVWGERAGVPVLTAAQGTDPASLAFDAMGQAQAEGADLLLIDTAGRLQNRGDLMEELAKIVRVIRKKDESAPHNTLLVLDATTGQNAVNQVKVFQEISDVSGLVMTKLDGTAKGGVLVALADKFGLPIHAIGVGEQIDDLSPFDPQEFADALVGYDR